MGIHLATLWSWLRQELTYLHCHVSIEQLTDRIAGLQSCLNDDPAAVHKRLRPKTRLDPEDKDITVLGVDGFSEV